MSIRYKEECIEKAYEDCRRREDVIKLSQLATKRIEQEAYNVWQK